MKLLSPRDYVVMPWKNGKGSTTELYRVIGLDGEIDWRASIAAVTTAGPFSPFPGYDRHIMVIDGDGMILNGGPDGPICVAPTHQPQSFSGDWTITAELIGGPLTDFNLMSRRRSLSSHLDCRAVDTALSVGESGETCLIHVFGGAAETDGKTITPQHSLITTLKRPLILRPQGGACRLAICRIWPRT